MATLHVAVERLRKAPDDAAKGAASVSRQVVLHEGVHLLKETLVLGREEAGLRLVAAPGARPVISGAAPPPLPWQPSTLVPGAWRTILSEDGAWPEPRSLYHEGKALSRARGPAFFPREEPNPSSLYHLRRAVSGPFTYVPPLQAGQLAGVPGAELRLVPRFPWSLQLLPLAEADAASGLVKSAVPPTYPLRRPAFGPFPDGSAWVENAPAVMDEPGEWLYQPDDRSLHLLPPAGSPPGEPPRGISVARLTELVRIEGEIDEAALEDLPVTGIRLSGLTFTGANRYAWTPGDDKTGWGLQHDWEMYDRPTAMVRLRAAEDCAVEDCRFLDSGAAGLRLDLHARRNRIVRNEFTRLGGAGILLAGYGPGFKDVNRDNLIAANHLRHLGTEWWHSPGIFVWQSGHNRIVHNHLHHLPYCAIVVSGRIQIDVSGLAESSRTVRWDETLLRLEETRRRWEDREPLLHARHNLIARNDIHHVMERLADGNAVYVSGAGDGNTVAENFIHDIPALGMNAALRSDDDQHGVTFSGNVLARFCGEGIIFKGRTQVLDNVVFAPRSRAPDGGRALFHRGFLVLTGDPVTGSEVRRNVFAATEARTPVLFEHPEPWTKNNRRMPPVVFADADSGANLYWNTALPNWAREHLATLQARGRETGSLEADPRFVAPAENDFSFQADSPAWALGVRAVKVSETGPGAWRE